MNNMAWKWSGMTMNSSKVISGRMAGVRSHS